MVESDTASDLLCVIIDLNPLAWARSAIPDDASTSTSAAPDSLTLDNALDQILVFCNAHLSLRHENHLAVFAAGLGKGRMLFSSQLSPVGSPSTSAAAGSRNPNTYQQFSLADEQVKLGIKEATESFGVDGTEAEDGAKSGLVGALAMALCHVNRLSVTDSIASKPKPRILIVSVTEDSSTHYVPIMNCIFSAQKVGIPIDVCKVYGPDAVFLQQACHLTQGAYYKLARRAGLLQYLITAFLPGPAVRKQLVLPTQDQVDLRAACFCHRKIVDIGYVCSVCLSIFCSPLPVCTTCQTKFPMASLKRLGEATTGVRPQPVGKKRRPMGNGTPGSTPNGGSAAPSPRPATPV